MNVRRRILALLLLGAIGRCGHLARAQEEAIPAPATQSDASKAGPAPEKVDVAPTAADDDIATRLQRILAATGWFEAPQVHVDEGVVFLQGTAKNDEAKNWASDLARRTEDVVAVVNEFDVQRTSLWNLEPASEGMRELWRDALRLSPFILFGFGVLLIACLAARISSAALRRFLEPRVASSLLRNVFARAGGLLVLLLGVYIVLRVAGLTRLAMTVVGGTGILGLVIGIAFRDITENFLASIFLSTRQPFLTGDLVEIAGIQGYVQRLTTRATVLMALNGTLVEIPNATVYKSTIRNFSTNKNRREDFTIGVGYDVPISKAQEVALAVLRRHAAVLDDPEPWALVESLASSAVTLRIYFWFDGSEHSAFKVKSSVIRLVKRAFQESGVTIPDDAREIIFPRGVPVQVSKDGDSTAASPPADDRRLGRAAAAKLATEPLATSAEGDLSSDAQELEDQARKSRPMDEENLLKPATGA